jgi:RNA polymerase sigma factor (sigma-70 family)
MASGQIGAIVRQVHRLFDRGSVAGLSEGQLLERFVARGDEEAFAALVARYGPMVLGVCRRLLDDSNDVDDAFQATFLVLVRRAGSIRDRDLLGNWLYGVAHRVAARARADVARRRSRLWREGEAAMATGAGPDRGPCLDETGSLLHEEVNRLPEKYRVPVVLCYLEGRTHEEAARLLRWPVGTVKGRLARVRDLLRDRLSRRGLALPAVAVAATLARDAEAAVPQTLLESTVKAATGVAAGQAVTAGSASATATAWAEGVLKTMFAAKLKALTLGAVALGLVATGAGVRAVQDPGPRSDASPVAKSAGAPDDGQATKAVPRDFMKKAAAKAAGAGAYPGMGGPPAGLEAGQDAADGLAVILDARLKAALHRCEVLRSQYEHGVLAFEYYLSASQRLMEAQRDLAGDPAGQLAPIEAHVKRLEEAMKIERLKVKSSRIPDDSEAELALQEARYLLAKTKAGQGPGDDPEDRAKTEAILRALNQPISMSFTEPTPLGDVLEYIQSVTVSKELPEGIPIYLDPTALKNSAVGQADEVDKLPIKLNLKGVRLKTSLRLLLNQVGLSYVVKEGLLIISAPGSTELQGGMGGVGEAGGAGKLGGGGFR